MGGLVMPRKACVAGLAATVAATSSTTRQSRELPMAMRASLFVLAMMAMFGTAPAIAFDGLKTPSNNIVCILDDSDPSSGELRCDIANLRPTKLRPPKDCHLGWGDAFAVSQDGKSGARICHGDTVMHEDVAMLPYGAVWQRGAFTCRSEPNGLTCMNAQGHGFSISRSSQRVF
jgi:hypothetical protein